MGEVSFGASLAKPGGGQEDRLGGWGHSSTGGYSGILWTPQRGPGEPPPHPTAIGSSQEHLPSGSKPPDPVTSQLLLKLTPIQILAHAPTATQSDFLFPPDWAPGEPPSQESRLCPTVSFQSEHFLLPTPTPTTVLISISALLLSCSAPTHFYLAVSLSGQTAVYASP